MGTVNVLAVWFPGDPALGAAIAANLAGVAGAPKLVIDLDADWRDAACVVLDDEPDDLSTYRTEAGSSAAPGRSRVEAVSGALETGTITSARAVGGAIVALPATHAAGAVAAECDAILLGLARSFLSLRRARMALDALPGSHAPVIAVVCEGTRSDITETDVASVLAVDRVLSLPDGGRELARSIEYAQILTTNPGGPWASAVCDLARDIGIVDTAGRDGRRCPPLGAVVRRKLGGARHPKGNQVKRVRLPR